MKKNLVFVFLMLVACNSNQRYSLPEINCEGTAISSTHTIAQVKEMSGFGIENFTSDIIISGYVVSNDASGNIYKTLILQDNFEQPTSAIEILVDETNLYSVFPVGRKVFLKLNGLSIGYQRGMLVIGKVSNTTIERIPRTQIFNHFVRGCETEKIIPKPILISDIDDTLVGMYVSIQNAQFHSQEMGFSFGEINGTESVERIVVQYSEECAALGEIRMPISGYSDFKRTDIPAGNGNISGVLTKYFSEYQLLINDVSDLQFDTQRCDAVEVSQATISFEALNAMYDNSIVELGTETTYIFEGYVISSDQQGSFKNRLVLQDAAENPKGGLQVMIEKENSFEAYEIGHRVFVKLNRLYLDKIDGVLSVGVYKNNSIAEINEADIAEYVYNTREQFDIIPMQKTLDELYLDEFQNMLVSVAEVQLTPNELGKAFAYYSGTENATRYLMHCNFPYELAIETSGETTFANEKFPTTKGQVIGVVSGEKGAVKMKLRFYEDVKFLEDYQICERETPKLLITEVADPENNIGARFVELYNAGNNPVYLKKWSLKKYLNGAMIASGSGIDLSQEIIPSKGFLVIANTAFSQVFDQNESIETSYISGNGDDVYVLFDNQNQIHDVFGEIGVDGSTTNWEYTDGRAVRKLNVAQPNAVFDVSEWEVYSKINGELQLAPENFAPFSRN
ncbi:DUF5689 domain-containing protein [Flavicella marina]|uniref:DUF5689 domain-containing protein n=1 Tax=Flavicella marina TaxID=1475951 RepID=UPI001265933F|nr:DUF5689 domain-containing protein [Flavicella marina]